MHRLILLFLTLSFAGCMIGPHYQRPEVDVPAAYRYEIRDAEETANTPWWKQFEDPVLDGLIAEALAHSKDVKIAAAAVEEAAGVLTQVRSPLFPQASYGGSAARERASELSATPVPSSVPNPQIAYQVLAGSSWEIDLWGRILRLTEAARANLLATEYAKRGVVLSLVASVASSYLQLRALDEQLDISKRSLATYGETVRLFELQHKYGVVSQMTVEQARSQYETAAVSVPAVESQIAQTENAISLLLGRNPGPIERGKSIRDLAMPSVPAGVPSEILEHRPDIVQAEEQLVAANAQIGAAKALYFPTISLTGNYGTVSDALSDLFKGPARVWSYAGSITGPLFTGGAIAGQVAQAEAGQRAALFNYESAIQKAFGDVEDALVKNQKLVEQLGAQERLVKANKEYSRLARLQYNGGYSPYSTVLQAEQQLFPSELNWAQTRGAVFSSLVAIYGAMGGGWVTIADKMVSDSSRPASPGTSLFPVASESHQPSPEPSREEGR
jgi:multidrug efflux system outer membrane protein